MSWRGRPGAQRLVVSGHSGVKERGARGQKPERSVKHFLPTIVVNEVLRLPMPLSPRLLTGGRKGERTMRESEPG